MAKSDRQHAEQLLSMAVKDHTALAGMLDAKNFSEEVFGFHAQQTVEKALKAWIASLGSTYPKSHDVSVLIKILKDAGQDLSQFPDLEDYSVFAVQYRYEAYDEDEEMLDRPDTIKKTMGFVTHVQAIVSRMH
jgi:HEPN domain-containing protein